MFVQNLELKRGATWVLACRLKQVGGDWSDATYRIDLRATRESATSLLTLTPTAGAQTTDSQQRVCVDVSAVIDAGTSAGLPLGNIYADLRVTKPGAFGVQFPVEWIIKNGIQITRSA